jgi:hypothetical protein
MTPWGPLRQQYGFQAIRIYKNGGENAKRHRCEKRRVFQLFAFSDRKLFYLLFFFATFFFAFFFAAM